MARVLRTNVHITNPDRPNEVTVLRAGETVPAKFKDFVTNPKAFVDDGVEAPKSKSARGKATEPKAAEAEESLDDDNAPDDAA